jgi:hypothetical protein
LLHDVVVVGAQGLPIRPIPKPHWIAMVALDVVDHQMHAPWIALQLTCHCQVTRVQQACLLTSTTELIVRLRKEVGTFALPTVGFIPLTPSLLITLAIIFTLSLLAGWCATKAKGLRLRGHIVIRPA